MTLLVFAKKSAEASITSIAIFKDLKKQQSIKRNTTDKIAHIEPTINKVYSVCLVFSNPAVLSLFH
jgi:hypothetical protein